jgi:NAD(P)-dependent dehydrogenase (short-subunit alcohol dehydrogenase family)
MTGRLASKVVVVIGGGTGIGRAVAARAAIDGGSTAQ